jgi:hypothetical protein
MAELYSLVSGALCYQYSLTNESRHNTNAFDLSILVDFLLDVSYRVYSDISAY